MVSIGDHFTYNVQKIMLQNAVVGIPSLIVLRTNLTTTRHTERLNSHMIIMSHYYYQRPQHMTLILDFHPKQNYGYMYPDNHIIILTLQDLINHHMILILNVLWKRTHKKFMKLTYYHINIRDHP